MTSFSVGPKQDVGDCHGLLQPLSWLYGVANPVNALLFLLRIHGTFRGSRKAVWMFNVLWLSTWTSMIFPVSLEAIDNPSNLRKVCSSTTTAPILAGFITLLVFDTSVFAAVSYKVLSINMVGTWKDWYRVVWRGQTLGAVSKLLLRSGQIYYLYVLLSLHDMDDI